MEKCQGSNAHAVLSEDWRRGYYMESDAPDAITNVRKSEVGFCG